MDTMMQASKILIVDDDPHLRRALKIRLRANDYETLQASDASSAIVVAGKEQPDLIILDLGLPAGDGFTVLKALRNSDSLRDIPVIMLSARHPQSNEERAFQEGATAYFQKPADDNEMLRVIRSTLRPMEAVNLSGRKGGNAPIPLIARSVALGSKI
jgi:two-component system KDP operon response regulator KdpE